MEGGRVTRSGLCDEVQRQLPGYVDRTLPRVRRRLVGLHLRRCADCQRAFSAQRDLAAGLKGQAEVPGSGADGEARPVLSAALLVAGAAVGTGVGYAGWRGARRLRHRR